MTDLTKRLEPHFEALEKVLEGLATPEQQSFISCLLTAVVAHLPSIVMAFLDCMRTPTPPSDPAGYLPGTRTRCPAD